MRAWLPLLVLVACGAPRDGGVHNVAAAADVRVAPTDPLGWIGLSPAPAPTADASYLPITTQHAVVVPHDPGRPLPPRVAAVATRGAIARFTTGAVTRLRYGCEDNTLELVPLAGPRVPPGPVWVLPPRMPAGWQPTPLALRAGRASAAARTYVAEPLTIELARQDASRGTLTIARAGRTIHTRPFERHRMEGADPSPIDLAEGGPGIPEPIAAWSIAPGGPILLVLSQPGYEGVTLAALLVEAERARPVDALTTYLYACAF